MTATSSSSASAATSSLELNSIIKQQLNSLDDTDCLASAWQDALREYHEDGKSNNKLNWGGRGRGGRGLARRTYQPQTIVVDDVRLEYISQNQGGGKDEETRGDLPGKILLEQATLKLLPQRVYSLIGRNGSGKSTLLRRIDAGKIPGFPPHISCLYIPQEVLPDPNKTPIEVVLSHHESFAKRSREAMQARMEQLEEQLEQLVEKQQQQDDDEETSPETAMEELCEEIALLEDALNENESHEDRLIRQAARDALDFFFENSHQVNPDMMENTPMSKLSGGQRKKVGLAAALFCQMTLAVDLLLLDEPTNYLDIEGLIQLRRFILMQQQQQDGAGHATTILMISHDVDLMNDVSTDVIHLHNHTLEYYPGNYDNFVKSRAQRDVTLLRQQAALEKKRNAMMHTIDNMKKQAARGGNAKKGRQIESRKKKLERTGLEKDATTGHRWTAQKAGTGIRPGALNGVDASTRNKSSHSTLLKQHQRGGGVTNIAPEPDKAVQFNFRPVASSWGEPLIMALDLGHGYQTESHSQRADEPVFDEFGTIVKKPGFLFDCVDICVEEGSTVCILGEVGSGKSTLLRLLAGRESPLEGRVHRANNVSIAYFDQHEVDRLIQSGLEEDGVVTPLSLLSKRYPLKTEHDIRAELTNFGLDPKQATTMLQFLSGGERSRLCLANLMLADPHVLIMDEPSSHLDVESLDAFVYGLNHWNGTVLMVSHDANLVRSIHRSSSSDDDNGISQFNGCDCFVIMSAEGKVRRVPDGIDTYLKSFNKRK